MANWDDLKQTFFEETKEGLEAIDAGLTDIRDGSESDDTVNAVFRAIHSAKGGAGVFGFDADIALARAAAHPRRTAAWRCNIRSRAR